LEVPLSDPIFYGPTMVAHIKETPLFGRGGGRLYALCMQKFIHRPENCFAG